MTVPAAALRPEASSGDWFARACTHLGFDDPALFAPRRAAVLSALEAVTRLDAAQLRTIVRAQRPHVLIAGPDRPVTLDGELRAALGCLREEARLHARLVAVGQAWAGCNRLTALITLRRPVVTRIVASAVAGEVLCRLLDDLQERYVLSRDDEDLLRHAWRQAHPLPAYFLRPCA